MAPKPADKSNPKTPGKGKSKGGDMPQASKIEFALPSAMVTCLQAITSRSTQDLWTSPTAVPTDLSVEQQAQRRASAVGKLSKRINGNLRAKEELRTALQTWMSTIGLHLAGLAQRVRALGDKVDVDLAEACREMQEALAAQPSLATSEQVATAIDAIGKPIWSLPQEQETLRLAASLRAFSVVEVPARGADVPSEVSFGAAGLGPFGSADSVMSGDGAEAQMLEGGENGRLFHTGDAPSAREMAPASAAPAREVHTAAPEGVASRAKRWRRRDGADASRPSKSPRREVLAGAPWPASATGTTPDALHRQPRTQLLEVEEPVRPTADAGLTWELAWQQVLQFALEHGTAMVGEVIRDPQQDTVLPLQDQSPEDRTDLLSAAEDLWMVLQAAAGLADAAVVPSLCVRLQELLNRVRQCPSALSGIRQGTLLMAQITVGNLLDPYSFAPTTAQEWLFPAANAEHGALARGHIATMPSASQAMYQTMAFRTYFRRLAALAQASLISGVQIWQQSFIQGQPVFTTNSVPPVQDVRDLQPVRMHGQLLHRMICSAFGLVDSEWCLRRLVEALPSLPPEQYVLSPVILSWDQVLVPVDLRPLGGQVRLQLTNRCVACGEVAARAMQTQHLGPCPVTLCRTSQGWFHPTARLLLLPFGDAFQVWPMHQAPTTELRSLADNEDRAPTLEDRFSTSLSLPSTGELAYHDLSGANAVILHMHGHTYACVPSYADHLTSRSAALDAVAADLQIQPAGRLCFARLLPPLDRMPAIQYVAAYCCDGEVMGVVDLRPSNGGVYVVAVPEGATPAERISVAINMHGEPAANSPIAASLAQGHLQVLHREHVVDPFAPLNAAQPAPIVVLRRRSNLAAGYRDPSLPLEDSGTDSYEVPLFYSPEPEEVSAAASSASGWIGPLLGCLSVSVAPRPCLLPLLVAAALAVRDLAPSEPLSSHVEGRPWTFVQQHPSLASFEEHATLGRSLSALDARNTLSLTFDMNAGLPEFRICVWSPAEQRCFFVAGSAQPHVLRERLFETKVVMQRHDCVPWDPLPFDRGIHYVATNSDAAVVTVIADTGKEYFCLDVPRRHFGASFLQALQLLCPQRCFRISENVRTPVRNGDVIRVFDDQLSACGTPQFYVPRFSLPPVLEAGTQMVYVVSADMGTIRLKIPLGVEVGVIERALVVWLGRQRCLGTRLHKLDLDVAVPVYCLPRRGRSTLAVGLIDLADPVMDTIVHVVDSAGLAELDCEVLREPWRPASLFWNDVLEREPVCIACWSASDTASGGKYPVRLVTLGLDICRALGSGWQPPAASMVPEYDLVVAAEHLGIQWGHAQVGKGKPASTQTAASYWPMQASPLFSSAMPVPRRADGCSFDDRHGAEGTLFHLECPQMQVRCTIPCVAGRHIWAIRMGNWVRAACTTTLGWDEVLDVAGLSYWDLPGTSIHGPHQVWTWPEDVLSLSGQCGHVMHSGSDPCLECLYSADPRPQPVPPEHSAGFRPLGSTWIPLLLSCFAARRLGCHWIVFIFVLPAGWATGSSGSSDTPSVLHSPSSSEGLAGMENSTPGCIPAWCHELSCQSTHFTVDAVSLAEYFLQHSPTELVRVQLWVPFQGPSLFDFLRDEPAEVLHSKLLAAGHDPTRRVLYVAFDTQSTVVDLLSVPPASGRWWMVRDGISRELLRPVTTWVEANRRAVVTLNSHGQVASLVATPETAALYNLPQGAKGVTATPLTRVYGHLTALGLVLFEASIGTVSGLAPRPLPLLGALLLTMLPSHAMMQGQVVPARNQAHWHTAQDLPRQMRVWTHTLAAPVVVPYAAEPNPARLSAAVAATHRGVRGDGVFDWTVPRQHGDAAHIIHYPAGLCPPFVFWLVHYRGRGSVICATPGNIDWPYLAREAAEAFASSSFMQGSFGIQHNGRVFAYGSELAAPPHGTILHLVRTGVRSSANTASSVWDAPAELPWIPQFEYNLCLGPGGEAPIQDGSLEHRSAPCSGDELQASLSYMQHLLGGLEQSVERCQAVAVALEAQQTQRDSVPYFNGEQPEPADSAAWGLQAPGMLPRLGMLAALGFLGGGHIWLLFPGLLAVAPTIVKADASDDEVPDGPTEPSSPDLTELQAPTPTGNVEHGVEPSVGIIQRPSDSSLASTSAPLRGEIEPQLDIFDAHTVARLQRTVAACLSEVDVEDPTTPFIPAGCPFTIHNPFTCRSQCKIMSELIQSPQALRAVLSDFSARRGWQPLVSLQPQPDARSIHLIPAAANPDLAAVVLRTGSALQPICLARTWQGNPYRRIVLNGRHGRLREPYSISRGSGGAVAFRDGDCMHADMGPFGPPPPTPARSDGHRLSITVGVIAVMRFLLPGRFALLCLALLATSPAAVQLVPPAPDGVSSARYSVSHYPWREAVEQQHLNRVCRDKGCRISLLCPWRGPQGLYHTTSQATLHDVWHHYEESGRPQELMPVWPGLTADRLWFVPRAHIAGALVCVVAHQDTRIQALVIPTRSSPARLLQTIRYMTGWAVDSIGLPPGLHTQVDRVADASCLLRDGDVLDALSSPDQRRPYLIRSPSDLKSNVLWTQHMTLQQPTFIRIWTPRIRPSILLCIAVGEHWEPEKMSFTGEFRHNHPGRWVPVPWAPCRLPHFVQAAEEEDCANILFEEPCGVHCVTLDRRVTPYDITLGTPEHSRGVRVLGNLHIGTHAPLDLRDGDIVVTHLLARAEDSAWPDLRNSVSGVTSNWNIRFAACLLLPTNRLSCLAAMVVVHRDSGNWAVGYLPVGGDHIDHFTIILPLPPAHEYMLAQGATSGLQVLGPPSLRRVGGYEVLGTRGPGIAKPFLHWIPDGSLWSPKWLQFSVDGRPLSQGRWVPTAFLPEYEVGFVEQPDPLAVHVLLYQPYDPTATSCRRLLLEPSAERTALNRVSEEWQLRPDLQARVSVPWPRNGDVMVPRIQHTALQASLLSAGLTGFAYKSGPCLLWISCFLSLSVGALADKGHSVAEEILPTAPSLEHIPSLLSIAVFAVSGRFCTIGLLPFAAAMVMPTAEQQQTPPVSIGKFPWRDPPQYRVCGDSVFPGARARLLSPFRGDGDEVEVSADTSIDDLRISLTGAEPYWHGDIMPVWPSMWPQTSVYVPIPTGGDLVCIAVVSPEWQLAVLTPRRADLDWLLAYLRRITPGPILSLHPPLAACPDEASQAIDWRSGDVLLAFQCGSTAVAYELPVFLSPAHVRHAAIWNYDFVVQCEVPLLMWRVGRRPAATTMPPPARWVASEQTFTGRFGTKYPGRWAPVPWAHTEHVALCQSADSPDHCNIIFETCENLHLSGECLTVSTSSSKYSLSQLTGVNADSLTLLGQGVDTADFPPLRDGDVIFHDAEGETGRTCRNSARPVLAVLVCGLSKWACPVALVGSWWPLVELWIGSSLPTLLLVHGSAAAFSQYLPLVEPLVEKMGYGIVTFDWYGCGGSDKPDSWSAYSFDELLADLKEVWKLAAACGTGPHFVAGHSFGTHLVIRLVASLALETETKPISGLVLLGGARQFPEGHPIFRLPVFLLSQFQHGMTDAFLKMALADSCDPELRKQEEDACNANPMYMCKAYYRQVRNATDVELNACVDMPALVIRGEQDGIISAEDAKALVATLPKSKGVEVQGAGHAPMLEAPSEVAELVVEFVKTVMEG
ncbi:ABHD8 [Symbiodinium necroappetens]|uniref:ABHD8 protein n=1 Tax=Symbiodinium necroappetens TaxID=1628268 RepID=A0A812J916_9DINO|nr:ABHD8 [Symbiodinium necroappetens]